ncbi:predicted protein [Scheffersomyces stipitis CBS 6054]|uniref:Fe2OG dioxygenase domain-containing protein n=1 Tax=Scheffersomyces stipitis (strain ATCC 58785 / CBS 6054 / NBRC 10063 / NRRL Y-11545) TaxID=322104 RepID=A3LWY7_PICST|nr:predicted protein [Scheffersomyces stipitis CBS 6054]ABN67364.2 predicted protein [Scheffersomyces stipitis CBS 6054]KAG2732245.1 hypothetical protein G9P44_004662 [Scheffersomyces stipitis]
MSALSAEELDRKYNVRPFVDPEPTKIDVNPLVLTAIDLSLFKEGDEHLNERKSLAKVLESSVTTYGFFNLVNFGIPKERIEHIRAISQSLLTIPYEEKLKYLASAATKEEEKPKSIGAERGQGFKPKGYWSIKNGIRDSIDFYNVRDTYHDSFLETPEAHPELLQVHLKEVADYYNHLHRVVLPKLLRLFDLIFKIPEGTLLKRYFHKSGTNEDTSGSHGRLMLYRPYENQQEFEQTDKMFLRGHSDISALTFITSQPILALQIMDVYTGAWRYVAHRDDSLIVNIGDALEFISGGHFKACLHRVVEPPADQRGFNRLVVIYFCNPSDNSEMDPELLDSPALRRLGYTREDKLKQWEKIQFHDWNTTKGELLGRTAAGERNLLQYHGRYIERWHRFSELAN